MQRLASYAPIGLAAAGLVACSGAKAPQPAGSGQSPVAQSTGGTASSSNGGPGKGSGSSASSAPSSGSGATGAVTTPASDASSAPATPATMDAGPPPSTCKGTMPYAAYVADPKLCVYVYAQGLGAARQLAFAPNGDLFVNNGAITVLWDANQDGSSDMSERAVFGMANGIRHGIAFSRDAKFVYASSETTVYRFAYEAGLRAAKGPAEVVIKNIPSGGHSTRTLAFDSQGRLVVSIGSASNVDTTQEEWNTRAQVRRYTLPASLPSGGLDVATGEVIASGMRNEVGLYVDARDRIWGVENGRDNLSDMDFGGDIHNDNPGEEINLIDGTGSQFYGYPLCYSERTIAQGKGPGTQWADQTLDPTIQKTDAWCQDPKNVHPPAFSMPAHWAPLGIVQYTGRALPWTGDLFVASHGSWNRDPAVGRVLARAHLQNDVVTAVDPIVGEKDAQGQLKQGTWDARLVDVQQGPDQALYVSDDQGGRVFKIGYATK